MTPLLAQRPRADRAFERLYRRHVTDVYRYALAVLRNAADAEDVTQTTFMNAYRAFQRGERPQNPHNWLIAIAHNVCRQRFRQSSRRPQEVAFEDDLADRVEDEPGPGAEDIRRALGHLAFNQRAALVMRELEGRSYAEIGEILGVSVSAVETLIFRARRALREQLEGSLTCGEAELAISKSLDGRLSRADRSQLRAHLRECRDCATFARRQRAQRAALRSIVAVPLPGSLSSFFGGSGGAAVAGGGAAVAAGGAAVAGGGGAAAGGGAALAGGIAAKVAAVAAAGAVVAGGSYEVVDHVTPARPSRAAAAHVKGNGKGLGHVRSAAVRSRAAARRSDKTLPAAAAQGQANARGAAAAGRATDAKSKKHKHAKRPKGARGAQPAGARGGVAQTGARASSRPRPVRTRATSPRRIPVRPVRGQGGGARGAGATHRHVRRSDHGSGRRPKK